MRDLTYEKKTDKLHYELAVITMVHPHCR